MVQACEAIFKDLKHNRVNAPTLTMPIGSREYVVYNNASKKGLGCGLMWHECLRVLTWLDDLSDIWISCTLWPIYVSFSNVMTRYDCVMFSYLWNDMSIMWCMHFYIMSYLWIYHVHIIPMRHLKSCIYWKWCHQYVCISHRRVVLWKENGSILCIITMYYVFELRDLMHVGCYKHGIILQYVLYGRVHHDNILLSFHWLIAWVCTSPTLDLRHASSPSGFICVCVNRV